MKVHGTSKHRVGRRTRRPASRRGVALMLVMIALGVAGASTAFYLAGRENSSALARNATNMARAEWTSRTGARVGQAVLETGVNWRDLVADGGMIKEMAIGGGTITIAVTNLNGDPPTADDHDLILTATATVDGVRATTQRVINVTPAVGLAQAVHPYLNEFGLFATGRIELDEGRVSIWRASPAARAGLPAKVGLGSTSDNQLIYTSRSDTAQMALFVRSDAEAELRTKVARGGFASGRILPVAVPAHQAARPSSFSSLFPMSFINQTFSGPGVNAPLLPGSHRSVTISNGATLTLGGAFGSDYSVNNLSISNGGALRVQGQVRLEVRGVFGVGDFGAVELADDTSTLTVYAAGDVAVQNGVVGVPRALAADGSRSVESVPYSSPNRVRILGISGGGRDYLIDTNAIVCASVHAPRSDLVIEAGGALLGRATVDDIRLMTDGALLVDPSLDNRAGFTSPRGPLYDNAGQPVAGLASAIASFNPSFGVEALPAHIASGVTAAGGAAGRPPVVMASGATPRSTNTCDAREWPLIALSLEARSSGAAGKLPGAFTKPQKLTAMLNDLAWSDPRLDSVTPEADGALDAGAVSTKTGNPGLLAGLLDGLLGG